jgi:hypothetical protein
MRRSLEAQANQKNRQILELLKQNIFHFRDYLRASARDKYCNPDHQSIDDHACEMMYISAMRCMLCPTEYTSVMLENEIKCNFPSTVEAHRRRIIDYLQDNDDIKTRINWVRDHYLSSVDEDKRFKFINAHYDPRHFSRHFHGDVPLPTIFCKIIIDALVNSGLFSDPNIKFLFLQAKDGFMVQLVVDRLMSGLSLHFPDPAERRSHIWRFMIYVHELSETRLMALGKIFPLLENTLLQKEPKDIRTIMPASFGLNPGQKLDVALGSPSFEGKSNKCGEWQKYWPAIASNCIKPGGYLGMVTPMGWLKPSTRNSRSFDLYNLLCKDYTMMELTMMSKTDTCKAYDFLVQLSGVSVMVVQTSPCPQDHTTRVKPIDSDHYFPIRLQHRDFLTMGGFNKLHLLSAQPNSWEVCYRQVKDFTRRRTAKSVFTAREIEDEFHVGYTIPVAIGITTGGVIKQGFAREGVDGSLNGLGVRKIIFPYQLQGRVNVYYDRDGYYACSDSVGYIKVMNDMEAQMWETFFNNPNNYFNRYCLYGTTKQTVVWQMFKFFPRDLSVLD